MSMKYEGGGIMLSIDRIVRMFFAERLDNDEIARTGQTTFFISLKTLEDSPWQHFDLSASQDFDRNGWNITVRDRSWSPPRLQGEAKIATKLLPGESEPDYTVE